MAAEEVPTVTVLVLGEPGVGKSTFLSRLMHETHYAGRPASQTPAPPRWQDGSAAKTAAGPSALSSSSPTAPSPSLLSTTTTSSATTLVPPSSPPPLTLLPPSTQPHRVSLRLGNRPLTLLFYDTACPSPPFTTLSPDLLVLAFDVSRRATLDALPARWLPLVDTAFNRDERVAVLVLGLCRDRRDEGRYRDEEVYRGEGKVGEGVGEADADGGVVTPHEALAVAQAMRCDRYAECSALTGELCGLVVEDIAKMAAKAAAGGEGGARSQGGCRVM